MRYSPILKRSYTWGEGPDTGNTGFCLDHETVSGEIEGFEPSFEPHEGMEKLFGKPRKSIEFHDHDFMDHDPKITGSLGEVYANGRWAMFVHLVHNSEYLWDYRGELVDYDSRQRLQISSGDPLPTAVRNSIEGDVDPIMTSALYYNKKVRYTKKCKNKLLKLLEHYACDYSFKEALRESEKRIKELVKTEIRALAKELKERSYLEDIPKVTEAVIKTFREGLYSILVICHDGDQWWRFCDTFHEVCRYIEYYCDELELVDGRYNFMHGVSKLEIRANVRTGYVHAKITKLKNGQEVTIRFKQGWKKPIVKIEQGEPGQYEETKVLVAT